MVPPSTYQETPASTFAVYRDNPVGYAHDVLGVRLWRAQREIAEALVVGNVAVRTGHKLGKTKLCAVLALWWPSTRDDSRTLMTSASNRQVKEALWREVKTLYRNARQSLGGDLHLSPGTGLVWPDGRQVLGFSTSEPEKMGGYSSPNLFVIGDEASGIDDGIFGAIEGNLASKNSRLLMTGNPTRNSGKFYMAFQPQMREEYATFHLSCEDTPNVTGEEEAIPGLADRPYIEKMRRAYGEESPIFQVRVRGNFATGGVNDVIGLGLIEAGRARWAEVTEPKGRLRIGVDVARYGDDNSRIQPVRGLYAYAATELHGANGPKVAQAVIDAAVAHGATKDEPALVAVDEIGVGASVIDSLGEHPKRYLIILVAVNVATLPRDPDTYALCRDEIWFAVRDWLHDGGALCEDAHLEGELAAATYQLDTRGRYKVQSKDDMKKQLGRSPDAADALGLAVYVAEPVLQRVLTAGTTPRGHITSAVIGGGRWRGGGP